MARTKSPTSDSAAAIGFEATALRASASLKSKATRGACCAAAKRTRRRITGATTWMTEETQRLARLYERKHAALEAWTKSLLHQALTGAL